MTKYEITYLTVAEEGSNAPTVRDILAKHQANILSVTNWSGRRKLAYPIKKEDQAFYTTVVFEAEAPTVKPLTAELETNNALLRVLLVHYVPQPERTTMPEAKPETAEPKLEPRVASPEPTVTEPSPAAEPKPEPKAKRRPRKASVEETKALDEKLEELLKADITK